MGGKSSKASVTHGLSRGVADKLTALFKEIDIDSSSTITKKEAVAFWGQVSVGTRVEQRGLLPGDPSCRIPFRPLPFFDVASVDAVRALRTHTHLGVTVRQFPKGQCGCNVR